MQEKEYVVGVVKGTDLSAFEAEMTASTGAGPIPNRAIDIANPRLGSTRMTHFMLTEEEAENLRSDPRVLFVHIPPEQDPSIIKRRHAIYNSEGTVSFDKIGDAVTTGNYKNWGLKRCINSTNVYGTSPSAPDDIYYYSLDGTGVDIVIQDSGIQPDHPEWEDAQGNSRLQQIDWYQESGIFGTQSANHYRDVDGHGTHCAGIAAGKTFGWAKNARIYSQKLEGLETRNGSDGTGIPDSVAFDAIRLWHIAKNGSRPTVVNMSWGYSFTSFDTAWNETGTGLNNPPGQINGEFQGTPWTYGTGQTYTNRDDLWSNVGIGSGDEIYAPYFGTTYTSFPLRVPSIDLEIEEMIDAGIHICIASGNDYWYMDKPGGVNYNNWADVPRYNYSFQISFLYKSYYHQGSSPYSENAFMVGNISSYRNQEISGLDVGVIGTPDCPNYDSNYGPGVNIWAPGTNIMSACSTTNEMNGVAYNENASFKQVNISGTSMASPQVAGVCALFLQLYKDLTPAELQRIVFAHSQPTVAHDQNGFNLGDISNYSPSLGGGENRFLYMPFGKQEVTMTDTINISNGLTLTHE